MIPWDFQCILTKALGKLSNNYTVSLINYFAQYSFITLVMPIIHLYCLRKFVMLPISPGYHSQREMDTRNWKKGSC